jgi:ClpP class serine protease
LVDESFAEFRKAVRAGRSMTEPQFKTIGDGRMFRAAEAKSLGLIDRVQSLDETIMKLGAQQQQERRQSLARAKRKLALMTSSDFSS